MNPPRPGSRLWLWFVAAFVVQAAVWTAWITIAARHPVAEVPLNPPGTLNAQPATLNVPGQRPDAPPLSASVER
jgi:hypothetical protein